MKESVLILGAGLMQKPAILAAKKNGYKAVVIDADKNAACVPLADAFFNIDLKAKDDILTLAQKLKDEERLAAVFTAGTDFSASVSYVCEKLLLPSHSYKAALNASIKTLMRECFKNSGVPSPSFVRITKEDCAAAIQTIKDASLSFPLVIKPVDNMGARGCRTARTEIEFEPALKAALDCSKSGVAIVESFMEGPEFSIDALVYNGTFTITGFAERHIHYPPYFIETGHTMPAVLPEKMHDELILTFAKGAAALGLSCGAAKADIKYTPNGPAIGEIAGRLSGGYMSGWTFPYSSDLNLTEQALLIAAGKEPLELVKRRERVELSSNINTDSPFELFEVKSVRTSAERAWISIPGVVSHIENICDYSDGAVRDVLPRPAVKIGSPVDFPRNNVEKCGNVISVCNDYDNAVFAAENAVSDIFITLEPNCTKTDEFLKGKSALDEEGFPPSAYPPLSDEELFKISGEIGADEKAEKNIPLVLKSAEYKDKKDWNYNTIEQTARKFDVLRPRHKALDARGFWSAVIRGGLQGGVYFCDSNQ